MDLLIILSLIWPTVPQKVIGPMVTELNFTSRQRNFRPSPELNQNDKSSFESFQINELKIRQKRLKRLILKVLPKPICFVIPTGGALSEVSGRGLRHGRAPEPQPRPGCRVQKVVDLEAKCPSTAVRHSGTTPRPAPTDTSFDTS